MNRPPLRTMILGHPAVTALALIAGLPCAAAGFAAGGSGWLVSAASLVIVGAVAKANEVANAYKRWQREWGAMSEPVARTRRGSATTALALAICVGGFLVACQDAQTRSAIVGCLLILLVPVGLVIALQRLLRGRAARPRRGPSQVTVVARPLFPTKSLQAAYAELPEHCQRVLTGQRP